MDSLICSYKMLKAFVGSTWPSWLRSVHRLWSSNSSRLSMLSPSFSYRRLHLFFRSSPLELLREWRTRVTWRLLSLWLGYSRTYRLLEEDRLAWWHSIFMPCRSSLQPWSMLMTLLFFLLSMFYLRFLRVFVWIVGKVLLWWYYTSVLWKWYTFAQEQTPGSTWFW